MTSTSDLSSTAPDHAVAELHRTEWGRLLALLVRRTRRIDLAEDALAEAFARASASWPHDGVPANPAGWLFTTASRVIVGRLRADAIAGRKAPLLAVRSSEGAEIDPDSLPDERLQLVLLCCHPALPVESRSALALRLVIGTTTEEIAGLFLVPTPTMAARITRAKRKIVGAGIPLSAPIGDELRTRLDEVCRTIYLAFTAGYSPGSGPDLLRMDLAGDAVRLATILHELVLDAAQVRALHALVVLQHSRRDARVRDGRLVTLADQDRSLWRHSEIARGLALVDTLAPTHGYAEELRLQALIAAEHVRASTDWLAIATHYASLEELTGSPIVRLQRAVAVAEVHGPQAGLDLLAGLDERLPTNHRVPAVRGELAARAGDVDLARLSYAGAIARCENDVERAHLTDRLDALAGLAEG
jgi:RNA polymerase sigma-70 factor, ECF subfamily